MLQKSLLNIVTTDHNNYCDEVFWNDCRSDETIRGRCYDHNFLRFFPIFGEKIGVFLKYQCFFGNRLNTNVMIK
jgi:hypothetical protein